MVRLCDKEVYTADIQDVTRGELISGFCVGMGGGEKNIVLLYDGEKQVGYITYDILLRNPDREIADCMETAFITTGKDMFAEARKFFLEYPDKTWILVQNEDGMPECFAYNDVKPGYEEIERVIWMIEQDLIEKKFDYTFREVYPWMRQIHIYDFNEWAFRLYRILEQWEIPVRVFGDKWKYVLEETDPVGECPDYEVMRIFAESHHYSYRRWTNSLNAMGKSYDNLFSSFLFFHIYGVMNYRHQVRVFMQQMKEKMSCFICKIPDFKGLKNVSVHDYYRNQKGIVMHEHNFSHGQYVEELERVCGMNPREYLDIISQERQKSSNNACVSDKDKSNIIYLVGPCIVEGHFVWKTQTLVHCIQQMLDKAQLGYVIKTIGVGEQIYRTIEKELPDIIEDSPDNMVIFIEEDIRDTTEIEKSHRISEYDLDLTDVYEESTDEKPFYYDRPIHTNACGNEALANRIFEALILPAIEKCSTKECEREVTGPCLTIGMKRRLNEFLDKIRIQCMVKVGPGKRGAIVMNCNPFTLGHKYLIEQARSRVEQLLIFVVEEDKAQIPFADRLEMVKRGVAGMENVHVFPSGEFILSFHTFPSYFAKESLQEERIDASKDIHIFGAYIAPALDIAVRFAGTEPLDRVTGQYNEEMERTLREYGIEYIEIPRLEDKSGAISASRVRKYMENGDWECVERLVPESTYEYLRKEWKL